MLAKLSIFKALLCAAVLTFVSSPGFCDAGNAVQSDAPLPPKLLGSVSIKNLPDKEPVEFSLGKTVVSEEKLVDKGNPSIVRSALSKAKSLANFVCDLRGFDWSKEAADAILDSKVDPKNLDAKEYLIRASCDRQEYKKSVLIMQVALNVDSDSAKTQQSLDELSKLIGPRQAIDTYCGITKLNCENKTLAIAECNLILIKNRRP